MHAKAFQPAILDLHRIFRIVKACVADVLWISRRSKQISKSYLCRKQIWMGGGGGLDMYILLINMPPAKYVKISWGHLPPVPPPAPCSCIYVPLSLPQSSFSVPHDECSNAFTAHGWVVTIMQICLLYCIYLGMSLICV